MLSSKHHVYVAALEIGQRDWGRRVAAPYLAWFTRSHTQFNWLTGNSSDPRFNDLIKHDVLTVDRYRLYHYRALIWAELFQILVLGLRLRSSSSKHASGELWIVEIYFTEMLAKWFGIDDRLEAEWSSVYSVLQSDLYLQAIDFPNM